MVRAPNSKETAKNAGVISLIWEKHLAKACSFAKRPWKEPPDYRSRVKVLMDDREAARAIRLLLSHAFREDHWVAFDYETDRLKPDHRDSRIVCCSMSDGERTFAYPWLGEAIKATKEFLLSGVPKVASNAKFEHRWSKRILGVDVANWAWDTMIASHVLDNRPGISGLKFQAFVLLGQESYSEQVEPFFKSDYPNEPNRIREADLHSLLLYCGMDSLLELEVAKIQRREMEHAG